MPGNILYHQYKYGTRVPGTNYKYVLLGTVIQGESGPRRINILLYNFLLNFITTIMTMYNDDNENNDNMNKYKQSLTRYNDNNIFSLCSAVVD